MTGTKPATLADVAALAGVSVPTASRVLNGGVRGARSGTPAVRERVESAAKALGYVVSIAAQTTKDGRARTIALVVTDIDDFGASTLIAGVMHAAERRGVSVAVRETRDDAAREAEILAKLRAERHRAVIVATSRTTDPDRESTVGSALRRLHAEGAQVVLIGDNAFDLPTVSVDVRPAVHALVDALIGEGLRRVAIIAGPDDQITSRDRMAAFISRLEERGIPESEIRIVRRGFSREGGRDAALALGPHLADIDVIAAMSDAMAVGAISVLRRQGSTVPVTGFDHIALISDILPEYSTIEIPFAQFGEAALTLAFDHGEQKDRTLSSRIILEAVPIVHGAGTSATA